MMVGERAIRTGRLSSLAPLAVLPSGAAWPSRTSASSALAASLCPNGENRGSQSPFTRILGAAIVKAMEARHRSYFQSRSGASLRLIEQPQKGRSCLLIELRDSSDRLLGTIKVEADEVEDLIGVFTEFSGSA